MDLQNKLEHIIYSIIKVISGVFVVKSTVDVDFFKIQMFTNK